MLRTGVRKWTGKVRYRHLASGFAALAAMVSVASPAAQVPGSSAAKFTVTPFGGASYSIPITVPPGAGGVEPKLRIEYSSAAGYGHLGYGATLEPFSKVTRCAAMFEPDGFVDAVDFDSDDRFCMDGQRLVAIQGTYGAVGTEYRTELESFSRVVSLGGVSNDPDRFLVYTKSGLTYEYGTTEDSRFEPPGSAGRALTWAVKTVRDTSNNYMTFEYNADDGVAGEFYPLAIHYGGNSAASIATHSSVVLEWEALPNPVTTFIAGARQFQAKRIHTIRTKFGASTVRTYVAAYRQGIATSRSVLSSVQECAANGDCFAPTQYDWQDAASQTFQFGGSGGSGSWTGPATWGTGAGVFSGDFDGDGKTDLAGNGKMCLARGSSFSCSFTTWPFDENWPRRIAVADFNGDGRADFAEWNSQNGKLWVNLSNGTALAQEQDWGYAPDAAGQGTGALMVGDFNADGRADVMVLSDSYTASVGYSNGSSFTFTQHTFQGNFAGVDLQKTYLGDFNGDGRTDFLHPGNPDYNGDQYYACLATGNAFSCTLYSGGGFTISDQYAIVADFNGDSLSDFARYQGGSTWKLCHSTGTAFSCQNVSALATGDPSNLFVGDFDGNGMTDLARITATGGATWEICLSRGSSFACGSRSVVNTATANPTIGDFDGDGLSDIASQGPGNPNWRVALAASPRPDLLEKITNGYTAEMRLEYRSLADHTFYNRADYFSYPVRSFAVPVHVVSAHSSSDGIGGLRRVTYGYGSARVHLRGRGILGFSSITKSDLATGLREATTYQQTFPFVGSASRVLIETSTGSAPISDTTITNSQQTLGAGAATRYFPFQQNIVELKYELAPFFGLVTTTTTTNTYGDSFGNLTGILKRVYGGPVIAGQEFESSTINTYDAADLRLGRLKTTTVTRRAPATPAVTRASAFEYHLTTGLLTAEIVEPNTPLELRTSYGRDALGNITSKTLSGPDIVTRSETREFSLVSPYFGRFATLSRNALLHTETSSFDPTTGNATSVQSPNGLITTHEYDGFGRLYRSSADQHGVSKWSRSDRLFCSQTSVCGARDAVVIKNFDATGAETSTVLDTLERETRKVTRSPDGSYVEVLAEYDAQGRASRKSSPRFQGSALTYWTTVTYDLIGRVKEENAPISKNQGSGRVTRFEYAGLVTNHYDPLNRKTSRETDPVGNVVKVTDARTGTLIKTYDAFDNLLTTKDAGNALTTLVFDVRGRKRQMTEPNMGLWKYDYNVLGELIKQTDNKNQVVEMEYDLLGRMKKRIEPEGQTVWTYDTLWKGALTQIAGPGSAAEPDYVRSYTYFPHGGVQSETVKVKADAAPPGWGSIDSFSATPSSISEGGTTSLSWATSETLSCSATGTLPGWSGSKGTNGSENIRVTVAGSYAASLSCTDAAGGSVMRTVAIGVGASPRVAINAFSASPIEFDERQSTTLNWDSSNAAFCEGSGTLPGWAGSKIRDGSQTLTINEHGNYEATLRCWDAADRVAARTIAVKVRDCVLPLAACVNPPPPPPADPIGGVQEALCSASKLLCVQPIDPVSELMEILCRTQVVCSGSAGYIQFVVVGQESWESSGRVPILVRRVGGVAGPASAIWSVSLDGNSTATPGQDHQAAGGLLTWSDGDGADKVIYVPLVNDATPEAPEQVRVNLEGAMGASMGSPTWMVLYINDDDSGLNPGRIQFQSINQFVSENNGQIQVPVKRVSGSSGPATVVWSVEAGATTATPGSDYEATSGGTLSWADGDAADKYISISLVNDNAAEPGEVIRLNLATPVGATAGSPMVHSVYLDDDDANTTPSTISFDAIDQYAVESAGAISVSVRRTGNSAEVHTVRYSVIGGTALQGVDYVAAAGVLSWAAGESGAKSFSISITNDTEVEAQENLILQLDAAAGNGRWGSWRHHTVYIDDDDVAGGNPGTVGFTSSSEQAWVEGSTAYVQVTRTSGTKGVATVAWNVEPASGTATLGADYQAIGGVLRWEDGDGSTKTVTIPIAKDSQQEPQESIKLALGAPLGAALGIQATTLYIASNNSPSYVQFAAYSFETNENSGVANVAVRRTGSSQGAIAVQWVLSHQQSSAALGQDYAAAPYGELIWADGDMADKYISVAIVDDVSVEAQEYVRLGLTSPLIAQGEYPVVTVLNINDNDSGSAGAMQFASPDYYGSESSVTIPVVVRRVGGTKGVSSIAWQVNGTNAAGDHAALAGVLTWAAGDGADKIIEVPVVDDPVDEPQENVLISLTYTVGGLRGAPSDARVYIGDNDGALPVPNDPVAYISDRIDALCLKYPIVCMILPSDPLWVVEEACRYSGICDRLPPLDAAPQEGGSAASAPASSSTQYVEFVNSYEYDSLGRVSRITYPSGFKVGHNYNAAGAIDKVFDPLLPDLPYWQATNWDNWGNVSVAKQRNGIETLRAHDPAVGRLDSILAGVNGGTGIQSLDYKWNAVGSLEARIDYNQGNLREDFEYDELNRLTRSTLTGAAGVPGTVENLRMTYLANGNIDSKSGQGTYGYGARPHAVSSIGTSTFIYDDNGNLNSGAGRTYTWASYNLPTHVSDGSNSSQFLYGSERQKVRHLIATPSGGKLVYYVGALYEEHWRGATIEKKHHISTPTGVVAIETWWGSANIKREYLHKDHLGSTDVITGDVGQILERLSFDAFGKRRGLNWQGTPGQERFLTAKGFTGHEQLDHLGLIHMNGRVYDPSIARFISADPLVQFPNSTQSYNRYSYVLNNPLSFTDPSGFGIDTGSLVWGIFTAVAAVACSWCAIFVAFFGAVANGASGNDALKAAAIQGLFYGLGEIAGLQGAGYAAPAQLVKNVVVYGIAGGLSSWAMGGKFAEGFLAAATATLAMPLVSDPNILPNIHALRGAVAAVIGGTASAIGGGKFANGAITAAFAYASQSAGQAKSEGTEVTTEGTPSQGSAPSQGNGWLDANLATGEMRLIGGDGSVLETWAFGNNTTNPRGDPYIFGSNGPAPEGIFMVQGPMNTAGSASYGSAFFPVGEGGGAVPRYDIARLRGIGIHAGRSGPAHPTYGCLRVSETTIQSMVNRYNQSSFDRIWIHR